MIARLGVWSLLVALTIGLPSRAHAQPSGTTSDAEASGAAEEAGAEDPDLAAAKDQARQLFARGLEFFHEGRFKDAIDEFLKAHEVFPNPVLSFNAALAYEKMGDSAGALRFYREYLRQAPEAGDRPQVEQQISALERKLQDKGLQQVTVLSEPAGATVHIDGRPVGVTPWTGELNPGGHRLRLRMEGHEDAEQRFDLLAHRSLDVAVQLQPAAEPMTAPAAPPPATMGTAEPQPPVTRAAPTEDRGPRVRPLSIVALSAGVVTLGAAGVFEGLRQSSENDVRDEPTQMARHDAYDQMEDRQTVARVLTGVGAGVTVAGAILLTIDLTRDRSEKTALHCGPQGCVVRGQF